MQKFNKFFREKLFFLVITSIALGFLLGWQAPQIPPLLSKLIIPILFLLIFVMIVPMEMRELVNVRKYTKETLLGIITILILAPLIAYLLSFALPEKYSFLKSGLIIAATMPPGGMVVSWTGLLDANIELAMILQTATFVLAIVAIPLTLSLFLTKSVHFSQSLLIQNILLYIFVPLVLGFVAQFILKTKYSKEKIKSWKSTLATISGLCALAVVFISTSLKSDAIISHLQMLVWGLSLAFIYYLLTLLITLFIAGLFTSSYNNQIPIVYGTAAKNLSIAVALAISIFSGQIVLGVIFCFIVQMPMMSLFYRFIRKEDQEFAAEVKEEREKRHPISRVLRRIRKL